MPSPNSALSAFFTFPTFFASLLSIPRLKRAFVCFVLR